MSKISRWSYTNTATVWPRGEPDPYGGFEFGAPYTIKCTWIAKSENRQADGGGGQFISTTDFFHEDGRVRYGDMIAKGDHAALAEPTAEAREIKAHVDWDMTPFKDPMPDYRSTT